MNPSIKLEIFPQKTKSVLRICLFSIIQYAYICFPLVFKLDKKSG